MAGETVGMMSPKNGGSECELDTHGLGFTHSSTIENAACVNSARVEQVQGKIIRK